MLCSVSSAAALPFGAIFADAAATARHPLTMLEIAIVVAILLAAGLLIACVIVWKSSRNPQIVRARCECPADKFTLTWDELADRLAPPACSKRLVVLIAIQGSGKSLLAAKLAAKGFEWFSADRLVASDAFLAYAPAWRAQKYNLQFTQALRRGANVVDDNLNLAREEVDEAVKLARAAGYTDIVLVYFDFSLERCIAQNKLRPEAGVTAAMIRESWEEMQEAGIPSHPGTRLICIKPGPSEDRFDAEDKRCTCTK